VCKDKGGSRYVGRRKNLEQKAFLGFGFMGVKQISEDQAATQFEKLISLPGRAYGNMPFGLGSKALPKFITNPKKNILENNTKKVVQRKEDVPCHPKQ
jgi:hypothetical protein